LCVIVDANLASSVFSKAPTADFLPVISWLTDPNKNGVICAGGQLSSELSKVGGARRLLRALEQAGRARIYPDDLLSKEEQLVRNADVCKSNDIHVIALARVSGARVLCSSDKLLHTDFKNLLMVPAPRGVVYQNASHVRLLKHNPRCSPGIKKKGPR
jgi:hypothetical protein